MLSEADRSAAARHLSKLDSDGTRDELGFAPIHFSFADRFFPGTSVQHEQLRYVLFIAWTYDELWRVSAGEAFQDEALREIERRFSLRLMKTVRPLQNSGISGWTKYEQNERPVVRASTIYWSALKVWGVLRPWPGSDQPPNQGELHRSWPRLLSYDEGGDGASAVSVNLFDGLPPPPPGWRNKTGPLDFGLSDGEADYFKAKWRSAGSGPASPLLSKLAEAEVAPISLWSPAVRRLADETERTALTLAKGAASLVCIARAVHAALIETCRNRDLTLHDDKHAQALTGLVGEHRVAALGLNVEALGQEASLDKPLRDFLCGVQAWVRDEAPLEALHEPFAMREYALKEGRAYLSNAQRREDWSKGVAAPLDYRWPVVRHLINTVLAA
jgi:hypothetical protein